MKTLSPTCRPAAPGSRPLKDGPFISSLVIATWLVGVAAGFYFLIDYSATPGASGPALSSWPGASRLVRSATDPTLVMFLHPRCPCSRASIEELNRSFAQLDRRIFAYLVFVRPSGMPSSWHETDLWHAARSIPAVRAIEDVDGVEARRFGAGTSGACFVFDPSGGLRYAGGITAGRGHVGDNAAQAAMIGTLGGRNADFAEFPVFGCSLVESVESSNCKGMQCHK